MSDADDRFVESLAAELTPLVGPRLRVSAIDLERPDDDEVKITVTLDSSAEKPILMVEEGDLLTDGGRPAHRAGARGATRRRLPRDHRRHLGLTRAGTPRSGRRSRRLSSGAWPRSPGPMSNTSRISPVSG